MATLTQTSASLKSWRFSITDSGGREVGYITGGGSRLKPYESSVDDLRVADTDRRKGHGTALLRAAIRFLADAGVSRVTGNISGTDDVDFLAEWYSRVGFHVEPSAPQRAGIIQYSITGDPSMILPNL